MPAEKTSPTIIDRILEATFLKIIPGSVPPNYITIFRFVLTPSVIYSLYIDQYVLGLILFSAAAFTDALDGAMARTRNQITDWGKLYDPLADKLLVGSAAALMISRFIGFWIAAIIIIIEILLIAQAGYKRYIKKQQVQAEMTGKIKMILQSFGVIAIFLFAIFGAAPYLVIANILLYTAIIFALISLFVYRAV